MISTSMRRLEVFLAVVETGRFSLAAEQLGITQPSVSAHIAGLERQIRQPLFLRNPGRTPSLSHAGKSLLAYATDVVCKSREAADELTNMRSSGTEELTIAAQRCIANHLLPPLLTDFMREHPKVNMTVNSEIQENVIALVNTGQVDFGLFLGLQRVGGLPSEVIGYQPLALVVSPTHELASRGRVTPEELRCYPFVGGLKDSHFAKLVDMALRKIHVCDQQYVLRLQDATALTAVARRGVGIHCTPLCNVEGEIRAGLLKQVPISVEPAPLQIRLAFRPSKQVSNIAHRFVEVLRESPAWKH
jgi:LysR family transcriptional regulator, low CO2-responsive transcriptional regulator